MPKLDRLPFVICEETDEPMTLPHRFDVCHRCDGHGTDRGASVECDGGGFTASEWAEQDEDFREDYLAGVYDRPCGACGGQRVVAVVDEERCDPALLKAYQDDQEAAAYLAAEREAERRFVC